MFLIHFFFLTYGPMTGMGVKQYFDSRNIGPAFAGQLRLTVAI